MEISTWNHIIISFRLDYLKQTDQIIQIRNTWIAVGKYNLKKSALSQSYCTFKLDQSWKWEMYGNIASWTSAVFFLLWHQRFDMGAGVLQWDTLTQYLFIIDLDYVLRTSVDRIKENSFTLKKNKKQAILFTNPSARAGYDTRSIFKRSLTGLNSEFSFS